MRWFDRHHLWLENMFPVVQSGFSIHEKLCTSKIKLNVNIIQIFFCLYVKFILWSLTTCFCFLCWCFSITCWKSEHVLFYISALTIMLTTRSCLSVCSSVRLSVRLSSISCCCCEATPSTIQPTSRRWGWWRRSFATSVITSNRSRSWRWRRRCWSSRTRSVHFKEL